jgi:muramoyltetrapeptide carboxypeptidase LdcA involved in peptidoglycan recycling
MRDDPDDALEQVDYQEEKEDEERMEKIMQLTRDFIISRNMSIRDGFGIKSLTQDVLVHPYYIKRKIKDICGNDVDF